MKKKGWPEENELVVVKIKRIMDYGAVADLVEYKERDGFIHISNVTKSWVKNIRSHVSKGETRVAEVTKVNEDKNTINLSLKDVTDTQTKRKMNEWKRAKRTNRAVEKLAKDLEEDPEESKIDIVPKLEEEYGEAYTAFEEIAVHGKEALDEIDISDEWKEKLIEYSEENIKPPEVNIESEVDIQTYREDGIGLIKEALEPVSNQDENIKIEYVSAPKYKIRITAKDYEEAEEKLEDVKRQIKNVIKDQGEIKFHRKDK